MGPEDEGFTWVALGDEVDMVPVLLLRAERGWYAKGLCVDLECGVMAGTPWSKMYTVCLPLRVAVQYIRKTSSGSQRYQAVTCWWCLTCCVPLVIGLTGFHTGGC
jgi:hypothetical protein